MVESPSSLQASSQTHRGAVESPSSLQAPSQTHRGAERMVDSPSSPRWWVSLFLCGVDSSQRRSGQAMHGALSASVATGHDGLDTAHGPRNPGVSAERLNNTLLKSRLER